VVIRKVIRGEQDDSEQIDIGLDQVEGVLFEINDGAVGFEFDGTRVDVPRRKVEGVVYYHPLRGDVPEPVCRVADVFGSSWNVKSVTLREGRFELVSSADVRWTLAAESLGKIDYSVGNLLFLTDLEPESVSWRPYLDSQVSPGTLAEWFQPKRDRGIYGGPMMLGGERYERGLALHSRTVIAFRLTKAYRRFLATVGVDDNFRGTGNVRLVISSERGTLFERAISGRDEPLELDVDIRGARRLQILVDFGDDQSDSGDHLNLCNARLTK
jgi:hypothetical protein